MNVYCSAEHKGRYSAECGAPLTSIVFFSYYGSQWCPKTAWLQTFFRISSFVFNRTKKFIQVWNYLSVSKWWQNFHLWVNYPFKCKRIMLPWISRFSQLKYTSCYLISWRKHFLNVFFEWACFCFFILIFHLIFQCGSKPLSVNYFPFCCREIRRTIKC